MTEPPPPDIDELVSAVLDGEATPEEIAQVDADPVLRAGLEQLKVMANLVGTAPRPPAGLADKTIGAALTHLAPAATSPPVAPPIDEMSARRAARARRFGPILAAAAAIVLLAVGAVAVRNLDSDSQDTASAGLELDASDDGADAEELAEAEADTALESTDAPSEPAAADATGDGAGATEDIAAIDVDEFETAVREELDDLAPATTIAPTTAPSPAADEADPRCDTVGNSSRALDGAVVVSGRAELGGEAVTYEVFETTEGQVLVISDAACDIIAEIDL